MRACTWACMCSKTRKSADICACICFQTCMCANICSCIYALIWALLCVPKLLFACECGKNINKYSIIYSHHKHHPPWRVPQSSLAFGNHHAQWTGCRVFGPPPSKFLSVQPCLLLETTIGHVGLVFFFWNPTFVLNSRALCRQLQVFLQLLYGPPPSPQ